MSAPEPPSNIDLGEPTLPGEPLATGVAAAVTTRLPDQPPERRRELPAAIGRFAILRELGEGGMGHVYVGFDAELQREVAVKIVRAERMSPKNRARLRREAQALAQLAHPNVVPVFEVGEHEEQTYLAMELVVGVSVRRWLRNDPHSWQEIVDVFIQAARGLAAAHARGLVHRDFKPENAIVGDDPNDASGVGRVRVVDFGLVLEGDATDTEGDEGTGPTVAEQALRTETGEMLGTPGYMAPEQLERRTIGPAADQFALSVSLFEALTRMRPFAGSSAQEIASAVLAGVPLPLPAGPYPAALGPLLRRGLARDPAERWPSVGAMVAALESVRARSPKHRRRIALVVWASAMVLAAVAWWRLHDPKAPVVEPKPSASVVTDVPDSKGDAKQPSAPEQDPDELLRGLASEEQTKAAAPFAEAVAASKRGEHDHAARAYGAAAAPFERAFVRGEDIARIELARARAHLAAYEAGGARTDFVIAFELLVRSSYNHYAHPRPREVVLPALETLHELRTRPQRVSPADVKVDLSQRFHLSFVDLHPAGTEVLREDDEIVCREPCTVPTLMGAGAIYRFWREGYHESMGMLNPPGLDWVFTPIALVRVAPGETAQRMPAMPR